MSISANEKILSLMLSLNRRVFSNHTPLRLILIMFFYLPLFLVFLIYMVMFFSDELVDKVVGETYFSNYEGLVKLKNVTARNKTRPKFVKTIRLLFDFLRVLGKWLKRAPVICLVVGLIQMMEYEATLDSVRGLDFKLIERSIKGRDLKAEEDVVAVKSTINALTTRSGWALFPVAVLSEGACFENGSTKRLCNLFVSQEDFAKEKVKSDLDPIYGHEAMRTPGGRILIYSELPEGMGILLGQAGAYEVLGRAAFLDKLPYYLFTRAGLKKMYSKSQYIWWVISIVVFVFVLAKEVAVRRNRQRWQEARMGLLKKDKEARRALDDLNEARAKAQLMKNELEEQRNVSDALKRDFSKKLEKAQARETAAEDLYFETLQAYEEQVAVANKEDAKQTFAQTKRSLEEKTVELSKIKGLWRYDYGWSDRLEIERDITAQGNSPFIRYVSFVGFERFIKNLALQKLNYGWSRLKAHDGPDIIDLIDELAEANMISVKDKNFFHEVRMARNNWLHEGKPPTEQLLTRLVNKLEKSNPVTRPVL